MDESPVQTFLRSVNSLQGFAGITRALCWLLATLVVACLAAIAFDAAFSLPAWPRLIVDGILLVAGLVCAIVLWRTAGSYRFYQRKAARNVETMLGIEDNAIINAIDLEKASGEQISESLRRQAVEQGTTLSRQVAFHETVRLGPMVVAGLALMTLGVATVTTFFINPSLFTRVVPRYLDVFGNHPAYTSLVFDIQTAPETIFQGQSAIVDVNVDGVWIPENANLVQLIDGRALSTPMVDTDPGSFQLELTNLQNTVEYFVETDAGISDRFTIEVVSVPLFEKVWLNYEYPQYTGWETKRQMLDGRGVTALQGTRVEIEIESNIELSAGELKTLTRNSKQFKTKSSNSDLTPLAVKAETPKVAAGQFELSDQARFEVSLEARNGSSSPEPLSGRVVVRPDRPPGVYFLKPEPHIIAVKDWQIPVELQLSDDVGLNEVVLFRSINGLGPYPKPLTGDYQKKTTGTSRYEFDLEALGARAGDVITYYATVSDNYPTTWPGSEDHISTTDTFVIQIISFEEYKEIARQNYRMEEVLDEIEQMTQELDRLEQQRNEALGQMEDLQEKLESGDPLTDQEKQQRAELMDQLKDFSKSTNELADQFADRAQQAAIYDFEETYQQKLEELAAQLQQQSENSSELAKRLEGSKSPSAKNRQALRDAMKMFRENDKPFDSGSKHEREDMQDDLEQLAGAEQMLQAIAQMKSIIEQQRLIADRMKEFANRTELSEAQQQRLRRLSKQQDLLRQDLESAMENMKQAAEQAREKFPKGSQSLVDIVAKINESGVLDDQQQATDSGQEGDGKQAHVAAEEAARKLESLQCDCNGDSLGNEMAQGDQPLSIPKDSMGNSLRQLARSMQLPSMKSGKVGRSGAGYRGSMAKATLYGPHQPSHRQSQAQSGGRKRSGKGRGTGNGILNEAVTAENLTPEARSGQSTGPPSFQGVPSEYIEHARGYLKRITEQPNAASAVSDVVDQSDQKK